MSEVFKWLLLCRGLEKALDQIEAERSAKSGAEAAAMAKAAGLEVTSCFTFLKLAFAGHYVNIEV